MDPETREALDRLGEDLRGEVRTSAVETGVFIDDRIQASTARLLHQMRELESRTRRQFDVVTALLRGDIRGLAELAALSNESPGRRVDEQARRIDSFEGRVLRPEVRVSNQEDDRKRRRARRRR